VAGFDRSAGTIVLHARGDSASLAPLVALRAGETASFDGPLGRGFELDARSRHLLVVADEPGLERVLAVVGEAVSSGRQVVLIHGAGSVGVVAPSSLLPDEVEYVVATEDGTLGHHGSAADLVPAYEAWADQCLAAGSAPLLGRLASLARGRDGRLGVARLGRRRGRRPSAGAAPPRRTVWLQTSLPHEVGCSLGICLGCVVEGSRGPRRVCRDGPVFGADELRLEAST
jgi:dihydroorotate dehydrogenase electron transfer subunit